MIMFIELVKLGFLGFAVAVLILSFWLLRGITTNLDLSDSGVSIRAREIRIYMACSILVVLLGLGWELLNPRVLLYIDVNPNDMDGLAIRAGSQKIEWKKGKNTIEIPDGRELTLDLTLIDRQLRGTKNYTREIKEMQRKEATGNNQTEEAGL